MGRETHTRYLSPKARNCGGCPNVAGGGTWPLGSPDPCPEVSPLSGLFDGPLGPRTVNKWGVYGANPNPSCMLPILVSESATSPGYTINIKWFCQGPQALIIQL